MRERDLQVKFKHWIQAVYKGGSAGFELKLSKSNSLPRSAFAPHQLDALYAAQYGQLYHKISDESRDIKPFDCFVLQGAKGYVVIGFRSGTVLIGIREYLQTTKSITYTQALQIGTKIF